MIAGVRGRLITASFAETELPALCGDCVPSAKVIRDVERWSTHIETSVGPASSVRTITDAVAIPLLRILGFDVIRRSDSETHARLDVGWRGTPVVPATVATWDHALDSSWRASVLDAIRVDARWCFCFSGTRLRIVDAHRTWSRHFLEFDLAMLAHTSER